MNNIRRIAVCLMSAALVACGGGGGSASASKAEPSVGALLDGPVAGIGYRTATQSGVTNTNGEYFFIPGETVIFFVGSIELPPVVAKGIVTPLDIANSNDIDNPTVSNILVFLQSLDVDGNHANGIAISPLAASRANVAVDFTVSSTAFASNAAVTSLIADSGSVTRALVSVTAAKRNFQNTLNTLNGAGAYTPPDNNATVIDVAPTPIEVTDGGGDTPVNVGPIISVPPIPNPVDGTGQGSPVNTAPIVDVPPIPNPVDGTGGGTSVNTAPVANAGPAQNAVTGATATLDGSASTDANNDALTFAWTLIQQPGGSLASLSSASSINPSLVPDVAGTYVVSLVVNDGLLSSPAATTTLTVTSPPDLEALPDVGDYPVTAGLAFSFSLPPNVVTSRIQNATITIEARLTNGSPLPAWLRFNPQTREFSGMPPPGVNQTFGIQVVFRDQYGNRATCVLDLIVTSAPRPVRL